MPHLIPILEFLHEFEAAGIRVEPARVLDDPQAHWARLDAERRTLFLARRGLELPDGSDLRVEVVKRRGRPPLAENVFVRLSRSEAPRFPQSLLEAMPRMLFAPLVSDAASGEGTAVFVDPELEGFGTPQQLFREASLGSRDLRSPSIRNLDRAWGGEPYDVEVEGPICEHEPLVGHEEVERYWVDEPSAMVLLLRDGDGRLLYHVEEPRLSSLEKALLVTANERLRDSLVLRLERGQDGTEALLTGVFDLLRAYRFRTSRRTAYKLAYYFQRNYLGFGRLEPLMRDQNIEDISCNGPLLPVFVAHTRHQTVRTNMVFDEEELDHFTIKLAQRGGKLLSMSQPLVDATLPDGSRIQACLGRQVTSRGSAFTIRKFREDPLTCVDLIRSRTHSVDTMAHMWLAVEMRASLVVMGATASGKTTTLNCLSQFIPPNDKIVTIEDTREITLQHENWLAAVTRESATGESGERVTMYDLLRAALRQRPEYILVGEIRGEEGLTLFQAMSTGHTCFSSMHAGSVENAVHRLENPPIGVPRVMLTSLDYFLLQGQVDHQGRPVRRMLSLNEVNGLDPQTRNLRMNEIYRWDGQRDEHEQINGSQVLERARLKRGWTRSRLEEELRERRIVLEGLVQRKERHYTQVAKAVQQFYADRTASRTLQPKEEAPRKPNKEAPRKSKARKIALKDGGGPA